MWKDLSNFIKGEGYETEASELLHLETFLFGPIDLLDDHVLKILFLPQYPEPKESNPHGASRPKQYQSTKPNFLKFTVPSGTHIALPV